MNWEIISELAMYIMVFMFFIYAYLKLHPSLKKLYDDIRKMVKR